MSLEGNLKIIKDAKLDIELLRRQNEKLCEENNKKISELQKMITFSEEGLETILKSSGEKKLECKLGWCSYREMPDKWEYDEPVIIDWCKKHGPDKYYHTIEILERKNLKNAIKDGLYVPAEIPGLSVTPQDPKFNYKLNGGI